MQIDQPLNSNILQTAAAGDQVKSYNTKYYRAITPIQHSSQNQTFMNQTLENCRRAIPSGLTTDSGREPAETDSLRFSPSLAMFTSVGSVAG